MTGNLTYTSSMIFSYVMKLCWILEAPDDLGSGWKWCSLYDDEVRWALGENEVKYRLNMRAAADGRAAHCQAPPSLWRWFPPHARAPLLYASPLQQLGPPTRWSPTPKQHIWPTFMHFTEICPTPAVAETSAAGSLQPSSTYVLDSSVTLEFAAGIELQYEEKDVPRH